MKKMFFIFIIFLSFSRSLSMEVSETIKNMLKVARKIENNDKRKKALEQCKKAATDYVTQILSHDLYNNQSEEIKKIALTLIEQGDIEEALKIFEPIEYEQEPITAREAPHKIGNLVDNIHKN